MPKQLTITMDVSVIHEGVHKPAKLVYFDQSHEGFLVNWRKTVGKNPHPLPRDALEFAECAHTRYRHYKSRDKYAVSPSGILEYVNDNPRQEVSNYVVLTADWLTDTKVLGLTHFRRTWCGNLVIDYLSVYPPIAAKQLPVKRVGSNLLVFIAEVAKGLGSSRIWGEATQNSHEFYEGAFKLDSVDDLLLIPRAKVLSFLEEE